jgi:photosystem II stability/assembly factor-like uncharacterized protein
MRILALRRPARLSLLASPLAVLATLALAAPALACPHAGAAKAGARTVAASSARTASASSAPTYAWAPSATGSSERFRGLAAVNGRIAWLAGTNATVLRTTDGGASWQDVSPAASQVTGSEGPVQFRDIQAWDAQNAVALAIGEGTDSRVLVTHNGGRTWQVTFTNHEPAAFYDCMGFFDAKHGLAVSDPVNGKFRLISTSDGGQSWRVLPRKGMPKALDGEFGFAASGTCLVTSGPHDAWIASGGGAQSRVYHSSDRGLTWTVRPTPIASGASAGIFSLAVRGTNRVVAVGGDFNLEDQATDAAGWSADGGQHWQLSGVMPGGYRSGAAWVSHARSTVLAVGPNGSDVSRDGGRTWTGFDTASYDTVQCTAAGACWASGNLGAAAKLVRGAVTQS